MMKKIFYSVMFVICLGAFASCKDDDNNEAEKSQQTTEQYSDFTNSFISLVESNAELKQLLIESIDKCKEINPDKESNPVQNLDEYYRLIEWSTKCMPWEIVPQPNGRDLFNRIDQSLNYFYWLVDQDLDELQGKGYYHPSLQYHEPFRTFLIEYTKKWGEYLSTAQSWNSNYLAIAEANAKFGLSNGWYESSSNWHSFNDFFSRKLASPSVRPIAGANDNAVVCSPADSEPQGSWEIDGEGLLVQKEGVAIKSRRYRSTEEMLGSSLYKANFANGTMTHTFLNVHDYHRYHFPVSGKILEMYSIPGDEAIGGDVIFDAETKTYIIDCSVPQWQAIETRSVVVLETEFGKVAVMPIGMSQICSCVWAPDLHVGKEVKKGDEMGYFLFGGSDIVMLFEPDVQVTLTSPMTGGAYDHVLMGEEFCRLNKK